MRWRRRGRKPESVWPSGYRGGAERSWKALGAFWGVVLLVLVGGAVLLQVLGPPPPRIAVATAPVPAATVRPVIPKPVALGPAPPPVLAGGPGRDTPGPISDPDPALLEPAAGLPNAMLPRIAEDGRKPMQIYAAGFDHSNRRPKVGLLLAGIGLDTAASQQAIRLLPGGVTFAVSPYSSAPDKLLSQIRMSEHEYLVSIPMEPEQYPLNDPGNRALLTRATPEENAKQLEWVLSRFAGYVGATGALGLMRGERFASVPDDIDPVLAALAGRGLMYVDPRPGVPPLPLVWERTIDVVIDDPPDAASIDARLAELDRIAAEKGSALGLAGAPRPVTLERIAVWANQLDAKGLALAPVSALARPPTTVRASQ